MAFNPDAIVGSVAGTGAALTVSLGFVPSYVKVFNPNDAGSLFPSMEWFNGMATASGFKSLKTVDSGATGNASSNYVTTNGITAFTGSSSASAGFTIGADTDLNVNAETVFYIAIR